MEYRHWKLLRETKEGDPGSDPWPCYIKNCEEKCGTMTDLIKLGYLEERYPHKITFQGEIVLQVES